MKLNIFVDVAKESVGEIKEYWGLTKQAEQIKDRKKYFSLVYFNILFLFVYLVPIGYLFVIIGGSIIYGPRILVGLLMFIPFILFILFLKKKAYPVMKENYLKK